MRFLGKGTGTKLMQRKITTKFCLAKECPKPVKIQKINWFNKHAIDELRGK